MGKIDFLGPMFRLHGLAILERKGRSECRMTIQQRLPNSAQDGDIDGRAHPRDKRCIVGCTIRVELVGVPKRQLPIR